MQKRSLRFLFVPFLSLIWIFVAFFGSLQAEARSRMSEAFWQPQSGVKAITPLYLYGTIENEDTDQRETGISQGMALEFNYGLFRWLAIGQRLTYRRTDLRLNDFTTLTEQTYEGIGDYQFMAKGMIPWGGTRIHFGADYFLERESAEFDSSNQRGNIASGGNVLVPYVSWQVSMGPFWWGVSGEWRQYEEREIEIDGVLARRISGGDELDILVNFEYNSGVSAYGLAVGSQRKEEETTTFLSDSSTSVQKDFDRLHARAYFKTSILRQVALVVRGDYYDTHEQEIRDGVTRESGQEFSGEAGLRFQF